MWPASRLAKSRTASETSRKISLTKWIRNSTGLSTAGARARHPALEIADGAVGPDAGEMREDRRSSAPAPRSR